MAKLITLFFVLIAIQACLILYADQSMENTELWLFMINTDQWTTLDIYGTIGLIVSAVVISGITAGSGGMFSFRSDNIIWAAAIAGIIAMGVVFINLAGVIRDELISRIFTGCNLNCAPVTFILAVTIAPVAFYYFWTVIEWWRGKDY
jgi:hypothetical protein